MGSLPGYKIIEFGGTYSGGLLQNPLGRPASQEEEEKKKKRKTKKKKRRSPVTSNNLDLVSPQKSSNPHQDHLNCTATIFSTPLRTHRSNHLQQ